MPQVNCEVIASISLEMSTLLLASYYNRRRQEGYLLTDRPMRQLQLPWLPQLLSTLQLMLPMPVVAFEEGSLHHCGQDYPSAQGLFMICGESGLMAWKVISQLHRFSHLTAIDNIETAYGRNKSLSHYIACLKRDKKTGGHPNLVNV
jgi:hypothetical protein